MQISGLQKTTLLDYPGHLAATIFFSGCNFRCPFCHNSDLVLPNKEITTYDPSDIFTYLQKRQGILDGVCITGGEPTLQHDLETFIRDIKNMSFLVKLDTNGTNPEMIDTLLSQHLIDYIAMDIKTDKQHYETVAQYPSLKIEDIEHSISSIKSSGIPYEFRTTVVKEFHTRDTFVAIRDWIGDCYLYALQPYRDADTVLHPGLHTVDKDELIAYQNILLDKMSSVIIRALD